MGFREIEGGFRYGQGDLYFPCLMDIDGSTEINMQESELSKCEWLEFKKLFDTEFYSIAHQVMTKLILPSVDQQGVIDTDKIRGLTQIKGEVWGRK